MIDVACPGCGADYSMDEARIPAGGHSMRCPKCDKRFLVNKDGSVSEASEPKKPRMATMVGTPGSAGLPTVPKPPPKAEAEKPKVPAPSAAGSTRKFAKTQMGTLGDYKPPAPPGYKPPAPGAAAKKPPPPPPPGGGSKRKFAKTQMGTLGDFKPPTPVAKEPAEEAKKKVPIAPPVDVAPRAPEPEDVSVSKKPIAPTFDDDLPAPKTTKYGIPRDEDLPARVAKKKKSGDFEDLPAAVRPAPKRSFGKTQMGVVADFEPPTADSTEPLAGISLPPGSDNDETDVFADGPDLSLPPVSSPDGGIDLPQPKLSDDLPVPGDLADLPAPSAQADLPVAAVGDQDLPVMAGDNLPAPSMDDAFGEIDLPEFGFDADALAEPANERGGAAAKHTAAGFGSPDGDFEFELPPADAGSGAGGEFSFDLEEPAAAPSADTGEELDLGFADTNIGGVAAQDLNLELDSVGAVAGADTLAYGEIDLGIQDDMGGGGELDLELDAQGAPAAGPVGSAIDLDDEEEQERKELEAVKKAEREEQAKAREAANKRRRRLGIAVVAIFSAIGVVGVALQFVPGMGLFGRYQIEAFLPEAGTPAAAEQVIEKAEALIEKDTYAQARDGLRQLAQGRNKMGLNRRLLTRSAIEESLYVARFGDADFGSNERVSRALARIDERGGEAPNMDTARAASFLVKGDAKAALDASRSDASQLGRLVQGEAAFLVGDAKAALAAYQGAATKDKNARTQWGLARGLLLAAGAADEKTQAVVDAVLAASPNHLGARVLKAHALEVQGDEEKALQLLEEATGERKTESGHTIKGSAQGKSDAWTAYGQLMAKKRNRPKARRAFERALDLDPFNADALIHGGNAMLLDARYADAFELFQRVLTLPNPRMGLSRPDRDVKTAAELGAARAMIETQRTQEAIGKLTELAKVAPEDVDVLLWLGKAYQKAEQPSEAEPRFREVITLAPDRFDGYMALSQLFFHIGNPDSAAEVLQQAKDKVEESAQMRRLLGESELARGYLDSAEKEFRRALELDPQDLGSQFFLGVVLRKRGKLDEAAETFDAIGKIDPKWPGLAVERGKVFEEKGESDRAARMYRAALEKNPRDLDLRLRLGAAQVSSGNLADAETNLSVVLKARPDSAEAEHFLGRVALERGNYESASARFKSATDLDPTQFRYFTYLAEAELNRGHITAVGPALKRAEELDPNDAELFLLKGRLGVRTGAVQDAIRDLKNAVKLDPELVEAYSYMGNAYSQLGDSRSAIGAYEKAIEHQPDEGQWYYRLGELFMNADRRADAMRELRKAIELGEKLSNAPAWLAESYRLLGDGERLGGNQAAAKKNYLRYLEIAPASAMDRDAVREQLEKWGVEL